jgi:hypothetical protein
MTGPSEEGGSFLFAHISAGFTFFELSNGLQTHRNDRKGMSSPANHKTEEGWNFLFSAGRKRYNTPRKIIDD